MFFRHTDRLSEHYTELLIVLSFNHLLFVRYPMIFWTVQILYLPDQHHIKLHY
jgi:hypothetical protein